MTQPTTDDDLWAIPAEHRDTIARWLIGHADSIAVSMLADQHTVTVVSGALYGAAVDLAEPGAEDTTLVHAARVLERLSGPALRRPDDPATPCGCGQHS